MIRTTLTALTALTMLMTATPSFAEDVGIPVTVRVTDGEGQAIPTAVIRHPSEQDRHRVNTETGAWTGSVLYLPNGDELIFQKNMILEFEISAPGYRNAQIKYQVRKRKNVVPVVLEKMDFSLEEDEDIDDPVIQFGRDKPLDK